MKIKRLNILFLITLLSGLFALDNKSEALPGITPQQEEMSEVLTYTLIQVNAFDPTRTITLRKAFVRDMDQRFLDLVACWAMVRPGAWLSSLLAANNPCGHSITQAATSAIYLKKECLPSAPFISGSNFIPHNCLLNQAGLN